MTEIEKILKPLTKIKSKLEALKQRNETVIEMNRNKVIDLNKQIDSYRETHIELSDYSTTISKQINKFDNLI